MGKQRKGVMPGQKGWGTATVEGVKFGRPSGLAIQMEIGHCLDRNPELVGVLSIASC